MKKNINFKIYTLGCKVNQYDSSSLKNFLEDNGFVYANEGYDLVIINSCSVTQSAIHKNKRHINFVQKNEAQAKIALIGCWPRVYKDLKCEASLVWGGKSSEWQGLLEELKKLFSPSEFVYKDKEKSFLPHIKMAPLEDRKRYFIKIQDGCCQFCSYCIIPFARGPLKSRPVKDVLAEINLAVKNNYQEFILSGIHLGLYGEDFEESGYGLFGLLKDILKIKNLGRLRLSSIEISELSDEIINLASKDKKICPHFHVPLQAGSDKILRLMNRPYNKSYFLKRINKIKELIPNVALSTDIIVGFPGESDRDFLETYNFAEEIGFSKIHVFSFSAHERVAAYHLPSKNNEKTIKERSRKLRSLSDELEKKYIDNILLENIQLDVLLERIGEGCFSGKTQFNFDFLSTKNHGNPKEGSVGSLFTVSKLRTNKK